MTKKVAINTRHGGFSISKECAEWLASHGCPIALDLLDTHTKLSKADPGEDWYGGWDGVRHDAKLVLAIETLGTARASGEFAHIQLYPLRGDRYIIREYDGNEGVWEPDDIRWISVP